jgi:tyrosine-protein kinase Etk/Wzc
MKNQLPKSNESIVSLDDLMVIWKYFAKNWFLFIVFPALAYAVANFYTHRLNDEYAAKMQLLLKNDETADITGSLYSAYYKAYSDITNQTRILTSYDLIEKAIKKVDFDVSYFLVGRVKVTEDYHNSPFRIKPIKISSNFYEKTINIKILSRSKFLMTYELEKETISEEFNIGEEVITPNFVIKFDFVQDFSDETIGNFKLADYQIKFHSTGSLVNRYRSKLKVESIEYSSILEVKLTESVPARAIVFLDTLAKVYVDYLLENQLDVNKNTIKYIDKQLDYVGSIIDDIDNQLNEYRKDKSSLELNTKQEDYINELFSLDAKINNANMKLEQISELEDYIMNAGNKNLIPPSAFLFQMSFCSHRFRNCMPCSFHKMK